MSEEEFLDERVEQTMELDEIERSPTLDQQRRRMVYLTICAFYMSSTHPSGRYENPTACGRCDGQRTTCKQYFEVPIEDKYDALETNRRIDMDSPQTK